MPDTKEKAAVLVIDMQNDFVTPESPLNVKGATATIPAIAMFLARCRANGVKPIYVIRNHAPSGYDSEIFRRRFFREGKPYCVPGTPGAEIVAPLEPAEDDIIVIKRRFSAFFATNLDLILRGLEIRKLYITGTQYPNCVRATAVDAMSRDYQVIVLTDCCSAQSAEVADANIFDLKNMGVECVASDEIIFE